MAKVNQQLIADKLNISRTTVSRSFSNHPAINPETRARVLELAAQMGYRYSTPRQGKVQNRKRFTDIGVIISVPKNETEIPLTSQYLLKGISERATDESLSLDVCFADPIDFDETLKSKKLPRGVRSGKWHGALLIYTLNLPAVESLSKKMATVSLLDEYRDVNVDCIDTNHDGGMFSMVKHLKELGHKKIGYLTWKYQVDSPWIYKRFGAYVESLFQMGLEFNQDWVVGLDIPALPDYESHLPEMHTKIAGLIKSGVTAWVCGADHQAYDLIEGLSKFGLTVSKDYSVTGFDGIEPPPGMPRLTSLKVPYEEVGISAVIRLVERMQNPAAARRHNLVEALPVYGETTSSPAS